MFIVSSQTNKKRCFGNLHRRSEKKFANEREIKNLFAIFITNDVRTIVYVSNIMLNVATLDESVNIGVMVGENWIYSIYFFCERKEVIESERRKM